MRAMAPQTPLQPPNSIVVSTGDGGEQRIVLGKRDEWIAAISGPSR
jgi:hypothetical protein